MAIIATLGITVSLGVFHQGKKALAQKVKEVHENRAYFAQLVSEQTRRSSAERFSGRDTPDRNTAAINDELLRLETEAEHLRRRLSDLSSKRDTRPVLAQHASMVRDSVDYRWKKIVSEGSSAEYRDKLFELASASSDTNNLMNPRQAAQQLAEAVRQYAREHEGQFPGSLDFDAGLASESSAHFELVFQGSTNDLVGVPRQAVALIRQRDPWPTPAGKLARIYVMADGIVRIVESHDHFLSWEEAHIIPSLLAVESSNF